jgi:hypothetical protein
MLFQHRSAINEDCLDVEFAAFSLLAILLFPVSEMADFRSFSTSPAACLLENFRSPRALKASEPRTMSATRRILRGEAGHIAQLSEANFFSCLLDFIS